MWAANAEPRAEYRSRNWRTDANVDDTFAYYRLKDEKAFLLPSLRIGTV